MAADAEARDADEPLPMITIAMNTAAGLLLPLLLLQAPDAGSAADAPIWNPRPGIRLRREVVTDHFLTAEMQTYDKNGDTAVSQRLFEMHSKQSLTATDIVHALDGGRPAKLQRFYDASSFQVDIEASQGTMQTKDRKVIGTGSVAGRGVVFTWIPEDEEFGRYYDKKPGIEEVLPGLTEDLGMRGLLPEEAPALGDSWKLAPGVIGSVLNCGGDVDFELGGGVGFDMLRTMRLGIGLDIDQVFGGSEKGEVVATWIAVTEEDGVNLAEIELVFDVVLQRDLKERAQTGMTARDARMGMYVDSCLVTMELNGSGLVRWNLDENILYGTKDLKASQRVGYKLVQATATPAGPKLFSQELVMVGSLRQRVVVTPVPE
jgi:hypothetical protein